MGSVAGGMNKRSSYGSMAERVARSRGHQSESVPTPPPIRHVWVTDRHGRLPGLLIEWRKRPDAWHGRVVHAIKADDGWVIVEEWLPAGLLEPVRLEG